jgi:hypothetical protein
MEKALPGALAELTMNIDQVEGPATSEDSLLRLEGDYYLVNNELILAPDPRVTKLPESDRLSPEELVKAILHMTKMTSGVWKTFP